MGVTDKLLAMMRSLGIAAWDRTGGDVRVERYPYGSGYVSVLTYRGGSLTSMAILPRKASDIFSDEALAMLNEEPKS